MSKKRILIVEDEFIIAQNLKMVLEGFGYEVVGHAFDASEALEMLQHAPVDLALIDINLGSGIDGVDLGRTIRSQWGIPLIFLTSHSDANTIRRATELGPSGYLSKPFNKTEVFANIEIALSKVEMANAADHTFIKTGGESKKLFWDDITMIQADHVYIRIFRRSGPPILVRESLGTWAKKLGKGFLRVHRSYVIALDAIESLGTATVTVNGVEISISKTTRSELRRLIGLH